MDAGLVDAVMAQLTAALGVVGKKILTTAEDDAADAPTRLGLKLLARLRRKGAAGGGRPELEAAVSNAADHPDDEDFVAALRAQLKLALAASSDDPALGDDLSALLRAGGVSTSVVNVGVNSGIISLGNNATNTQNRK